MSDYAFLAGEDEFDAIKARIEERGERYSADPFDREPGRINTEKDLSDAPAQCPGAASAMP